MGERPPVTPRLMSEPRAAEHLSLSPATLRTLPIPRKVWGRRRFYERADLDAWADGLPYEDEAVAKDAQRQADKTFGE